MSKFASVDRILERRDSAKKVKLVIGKCKQT